jgi:hypothetical protein
MGLANYLQKDPTTGKINLNPNTSLLSSRYLMALAAATELNIVDLTVSILKDPPLVKAKELRKQNGAILYKINAEGRI